MKGADVAMSTIVQYNDWLEEEVRNKVNIYFKKHIFFFFKCQIEILNAIGIVLKEILSQCGNGFSSSVTYTLNGFLGFRILSNSCIAHRKNKDGSHRRTRSYLNKIFFIDWGFV